MRVSEPHGMPLQAVLGRLWRARGKNSPRNVLKEQAIYKRKNDPSTPLDSSSSRLMRLPGSLRMVRSPIPSFAWSVGRLQNHEGTCVGDLHGARQVAGAIPRHGFGPVVA